MTMIVGLNLGTYTIVAADKREIYIENGEIKSIVSDDVEKIIEWNGGIVTGSGFVPLLMDLKESMASENINNTNKIVSLAKASLNKLPRDQSLWEDQTNWVFTYVTEVDDAPKCRIAYIEAKQINDVRVLEDMNVLLWAKLPDIKEQTKKLRESLKPLVDIANFKENIEYHLSLINNLFQYAATVDNSVCANYSFFIQHPETSYLSSNA